ncbi:ankyrin [Trichoderma chlorosporum]
MTSPDRDQDDHIKDVFLQESPYPTIAEHVAECTYLFRKCMILTEAVSPLHFMSDQLRRFDAWVSYLEVHGPLNVSLDSRLRFSPKLVKKIHELLDRICDILTSLEPISEPLTPPRRKRQRISESYSAEVVRRDDNDNDNDDDNDDNDNDESDSDIYEDRTKKNYSKIFKLLGGTLWELHSLSFATCIPRISKDDWASNIAAYRNDEEANKAITEIRLYTECYIRFRFPKAPDALRSALIEANAFRVRRMFYLRSHRRRISSRVQNPQASLPDAQLPNVEESVPAVRFPSSVPPQAATINDASRQIDLLLLQATNLISTKKIYLEFSYGGHSIKLPPAKSVLVNNRLSFPPIPSTQDCPYCGVTVEPQSTTDPEFWNYHVTRDLEPFICVFPDCLKEDHNGTGPPTFESSEEWIFHMKNTHGHNWVCRDSCHGLIVFDEKTHYEQHAVQEHRVLEADLSAATDMAQRSIRNKVRECPFGDDFQIPENDNSGDVFSGKALESHVAAHMKEIALLALQKIPRGWDENTKDVDSDQPLEDDGSGRANLPESMHSILNNRDLDPKGKDFKVLRHRDKVMEALVTTFGLGSPGIEDEEEITKIEHALNVIGPHLDESLILAILCRRDDDGRTALHHACMGKVPCSRIMNLLLDAGSKAILNIGDNSGQTALHYAAERDLTDFIHILVQRGADTRAIDNHGFSAFLWAVVAGQTRAVADMLTMGADVISIGYSYDGTSVLGWAASLGRYAIAAMLMETQKEPIPLMKAAASGSVDTVQLLLTLGGDPNFCERDGLSAIHFAAEEGHTDIVRLLLNEGANVNAISSSGTTPLHCAANGGHASIVSLLLQHQVDPLKSTCHGWTALHHAAFMGHSHVVRLLLEDDHGRSSASQQDKNGWSVLHLAIHSRDPDTIDILIASSAIAELRALVDESGLTAEDWLDLGSTSHSYKAISNLAFKKSRCCREVTFLRLAVITGNVPMIELLLRSGHAINEMNSGRRTALYHAANQSLYSIVDLLLDKGADPTILPTGYKAWEEFISDDAVLQKLNRAGYTRQETDLEVYRRIKTALFITEQRRFNHVAFPPNNNNGCNRKRAL